MKRTLLAIILALVAGPLAARAEVLTPSGRLRFVPGPGATGLAEGLAQVADGDRDDVAHDLGKDWDGVTEVRVALDEPSFRTELPANAAVPGWAQGVAFPDENLVVMKAYPGDPQARATLRHELSHIAVGRLTHDGVPRWFLEGLATIRAGDAWNRQGPSLVRAALAGGLFRFDDLSRGFPASTVDAELAYAESADFVSWLVDRSGEAAVQAVLRDVVAGETFDSAFASRLGGPLRVLEHEWSLSLARWELLARLVSQAQLWWGLLALLVAWAAWRIRRHKKKLLAQMELDEHRERLRAFAVSPAMWADRAADHPPEPEAEPSQDLPFDTGDDGLEAEFFADSDEAFDDFEEDEADDRPFPDDEPPKKPTLH